MVNVQYISLSVCKPVIGHGSELCHEVTIFLMKVAVDSHKYIYKCFENLLDYYPSMQYLG